MKRDNAFTGLEAAIVLIAFVVVAAIFSYVVLGAGFFATQKAQEVTYAGIQQATSNVVFDGQMYGNVSMPGSTAHTTNCAGDSRACLIGFTFSVKVPTGGQNVDMNQTTFLYSSPRTDPVIVREVGIGTYPTRPGTGQPPVYNSMSAATPWSTNGQKILKPGDFATYYVTLPIGAELFTGNEFTLEMKPRIGAAFLTTKRMGTGPQDKAPLF